MRQSGGDVLSGVGAGSAEDSLNRGCKVRLQLFKLLCNFADSACIPRRIP